MRMHWLAPGDPRPLIATLAAAPDWGAAIAIARTRLDFLATQSLDRVLRRAFPIAPPQAGPPVRLALLGSSTLAHLHAGLRIGALRRGLHLTLYETGYGQYRQELADPGSGLHRFAPDALLFALDPPHLIPPVPDQPAAARILDDLVALWRQARARLGCAVLQQTLLPVFPPLLGGNEHLIASPAGLTARLNAALRDAAASESVHLVALDAWAARDGLSQWHDPALWLRARQDVSPLAAPEYGDGVGRVLGALRGRSAKALVLDLDNTLWGGVIGDDGLDGIVLGQGSAEGEAFLAVQRHAKQLAGRGIVLAVCSKNDPATARAAFETHPDMILRLSDIACFIANWNAKPANLLRIAAELDLAPDSLVLLDDSPFERDLVRTVLPAILVPELPDDPALYPAVLADAGYFESVALTGDDRARTAQYQSNQARRAAAAQAPDPRSYLAGLRMRLLWRPAGPLDLPRVAQLVAKTNQFNLTTRRHGLEQLAAMAADPNWRVLRFRLLDRLGDNGVIAAVLARLEAGGTLRIDSWVMSCRVLGRGVERATLAALSQAALELGATRLAGQYRATDRNKMVRDLYPALGFAPAQAASADAACYTLALTGAAIPAPPDIVLEQG